jgi:hypothetical protein
MLFLGMHATCVYVNSPACSSLGRERMQVKRPLTSPPQWMACYFASRISLPLRNYGWYYPGFGNLKGSSLFAVQLKPCLPILFPLIVVRSFPIQANSLITLWGLTDTSSSP